MTPTDGVVLCRKPRRPVLGSLGSSAQVLGADSSARHSLRLLLYSYVSRPGESLMSDARLYSSNMYPSVLLVQGSLMVFLYL